MNATEQQKAAKEFIKTWINRGNEKSDTQAFWLSLLRDVFDIEHPEEYIQFEKRVKNATTNTTNFIDGYISQNLVLIEQKDMTKDLRLSYKQSSGISLTPYQQAKQYSDNLKLSEKPRWIITCNFQEFYIHDMENTENEVQHILLKDLEKEYYRLNVLISETNQQIKKEKELSVKAGELIGRLYSQLYKQYKMADLGEDLLLKNLNKLCVRLVFCLYAEDAGLFNKKNLFHDYLYRFEPRDLRIALKNLFEILDTPEDKRDPFIDSELKMFPYVNGGLFSEKDYDLVIPNFDHTIKDLILINASDEFDWSDISPTIFGAVFESTLNPETRRSGGMHFTPIENIHKVIDPLFLNDLKAEYRHIKNLKKESERIKRLEKFQAKLGELIFLDPACGSGNFLTETYISLRKLENQVIADLNNNQKVYFSEDETIKVTIDQFYGIEINDFAVAVAKTALWIAESQMLKETENLVDMDFDFFPLTTNAFIIEENALRIDWNNIVSNQITNYIMGNPPFIGFTYMVSEQKEDLNLLFPGIKNLDYVCCWYKKAVEYMRGTKIETAFVSTNSICQGETVARFWPRLLDVKINFAHKSFIWDSEANVKAQVHCVVIGFSMHKNKKEKKLFENNKVRTVKNINKYLMDAPDIIIESRNKPLCDVPKMVYGNKPADGGNLIIEESEHEVFANDPIASKYIKPLLGATEFINNKKRWCLWLVNANPTDIRACSIILERINKCKIKRESSRAKEIRKFAETPTLFAQITQPENKDYIIVPRVSSERRKYIPIGFVSSDIKVTDAVQIIPEATIYDFGVLTSRVHMAWMRAICGRLKSDYRYSKDIVYNNFPQCTPSDTQKAKIEQSARAILDARKLFPESSLGDLYDSLTMPIELKKAHEKNDKEVMKAYGFKNSMNDDEIATELMKMYQLLIKQNHQKNRIKQ